MSRIVSFRQMQHGTREDYLLLDESERAYAQGLADRVLDALRHLDHSLEGYPVSRLQHSLQAATRAQRDGADEELFQNYYYVHHFGGDRHARERLRDHPWYAATVHFCAAWDQCSFDPDYRAESLEVFEPLVRRILARPPHDPRYQGVPPA
jgi:predicted HD phosphohydrolase